MGAVGVGQDGRQRGQRLGANGTIRILGIRPVAVRSLESRQSSLNNGPQNGHGREMIETGMFLAEVLNEAVPAIFTQEFVVRVNRRSWNWTVDK